MLKPLLATVLALAPALYAAEEKTATVAVEAGGMVTMTDATRDVTPTLRVSVSSPVPIGNHTPLDFGGYVELSAFPGQELSSGDPETWQAAGASLSLSRAIGRYGDIQSSLVAHWAFQSALPDEARSPDPRLSRRYGMSLRLSDVINGNYIQVGLGHDEASQSDVDADPELRFWRRMQYLIEARVAIPGTQEIVAIHARASLAVGPTFEGSGHDIYEVELVADGVKAVKVIRGK
jgi:hypothetical protein